MTVFNIDHYIKQLLPKAHQEEDTRVRFMLSDSPIEQRQSLQKLLQRHENIDVFVNLLPGFKHGCQSKLRKQVDVLTWSTLLEQAQSKINGSSKTISVCSGETWIKKFNYGRDKLTFQE